MHKIKVVLIIFFVIIFIKSSNGQNHFDEFNKFIAQNIKIPDSLKYDCSWRYALIKANTNNTGRIINYECLNPISPAFFKSFNFIVGYKFPKRYHISNKPAVFYFSYENSEICKYELALQKRNQNDAVGEVWYYLNKLNRKRPKAILMPSIILTEFYATQH